MGLAGPRHLALDVCCAHMDQCPCPGALVQCARAGEGGTGEAGPPPALEANRVFSVRLNCTGGRRIPTIPTTCGTHEGARIGRFVTTMRAGRTRRGEGGTGEPRTQSVNMFDYFQDSERALNYFQDSSRERAAPVSLARDTLNSLCSPNLHRSWPQVT